MEILEVGNKFKVAILAAKRAKQIMKTGKKKIDIEAFNPLTVALEEIKRGLVTNETIIEDERNSIINLVETEVTEDCAETAEVPAKETEIVESKVTSSDEDKKITEEELVKKNLSL